MPLFSYKAQDKTGKIVEDTIQAVSQSEAAAAVSSKGYRILSVKKMGAKQSFFPGKISVSEKAAFCRFLGTMIRSGMSLPEALDIIREESNNKRLKTILADLSSQTQKGKSLSFVLSRYPQDFDEIFLTMVKVGEESGTLEKSFDYLSRQLFASHDLSQQVKGAMTYPLVIVFAMVGNGLLMMVFVLPRISQVFLRLNVSLPIYTKLLLTFGEFIGSHIPLTLGGAFALLVLFFIAFRIRATREVLTKLIVSLPLVREVALQIDLARFSRTLSTLLKSGVPIMESLDVSANVLAHSRIKKVARSLSENVAKGQSISDILAKGPKVFPSIMVQTIRAGEKSGNLEEVLTELSDFYGKEVEYKLKRLTSLLEPILMLLVGAVVGIMVIMMIAPIYSIIGGLQNTITQR